eukprot:5272332-Prymnesium_polylepis.1
MTLWGPILAVFSGAHIGSPTTERYTITTEVTARGAVPCGGVCGVGVVGGGMVRWLVRWCGGAGWFASGAVSYTHLRAHETLMNL